MNASLAEIAEWEGVAREGGEKTGNDAPPVSAFEIAPCLGYRVKPRARTGAVLDERARVIEYDARAHRVQQHRDIAHELGHVLQRRAGLPDLEVSARHIGGALLMPWREMTSGMKRLAWSVVKLRALHENVSELALAVRITQIQDAVVCSIDPKGRRRAWRRASPWVTDPRATSPTPSKFERELARAAWDEQREVHADSLCYAVPTFDLDGNGEPIVVVLCERDQLALRL